MNFITPRSKHSTFGYGTISISLPHLPFDLPAPTVDNTKPTALPVRGSLSAEDKRWLRSVERIKG